MNNNYFAWSTQLKKTNNDKIENKTVSSLTDDSDYININTDEQQINTDIETRKRLHSDTIEQIKINCKDYSDDETKIIKDFANIMETFNHIKDKLIIFESGIINEETNLKTKMLNQCENNEELDKRLIQIDLKLNNTIESIKLINSKSNELMTKIIELEKIINIHHEQKEKIFTKLNHIESKTNKFNGIVVKWSYVLGKCMLGYVAYWMIGGFTYCPFFTMNLLN